MDIFYVRFLTRPCVPICLSDDVGGPLVSSCTRPLILWMGERRFLTDESSF